MGFFDEYEDTSGTSVYLKKADKEQLIRDGQPFVVNAVTLEDHSEYGERYVIDTVLDDRERKIAFNTDSVESRDRMLSALEKWLDDPDNEKPVVLLEKKGRSVLIRAAD